MGYTGVLALQGGFSRHIATCRRLGHDSREFRNPEDLRDLAALIIPGGESTTIGMLLERRELLAPLRDSILNGMPVFGTCAGAILLARDIVGSDQLRLGTMDIAVARNAYGSQVDSFEAHLDFRDTSVGMAQEVEGVFIRAPRIESCGPGVQILGSFGDYPVIVRQGTMLAATFHPELTAETAIHRYFLEVIAGLRP